jgi:transposase
MRNKIPELREALQSRFTIEHHGVMVAQLLAHIDTRSPASKRKPRRY